MYNKRQLGNRYEEWVAAYLTNCGYEIIERNYRCKKGEIDLIARQGGYLVFVEVKYRADNRFGDPTEAIGLKKQKVIYQVAGYYMLTHGIPDNHPSRFDVVTILRNEVHLISDAF